MITKPTPDIERFRANRQAEIDNAALYRAMAEAEAQPELAEVYRRLAESEATHASFWAERLRAAGVTVDAAQPSFRARARLAGAAVWLGLRAADDRRR